jgi:hypothetical protein
LDRTHTMKNEGADVAEIERELSDWVDENQSLIVNKVFTLKGTKLTVDSQYTI